MGESVFLDGHPSSLSFSLQFGHVINPRSSPFDFSPDHLARFPQHDEYMDQGMKFLELDMRSAPSFSGGPLATVEGNVIGILHVRIDGLFDQGAKAAYGIPFSMIMKVLEKMHKRNPADNVFLHIGEDLLGLAADHIPDALQESFSNQTSIHPSIAEKGSEMEQ
ncbi:hypothetical protein RHSIM_Rhsim04G0200700 [Rhododendron simsii]|uniref:Serine protease n=1 Tax=Rhododendron simsii TaxID=118357 RepID=A0A834H6Y1_RHOSS|nr:hypothetical protein RHSIM_Rhsim04G0200700 [Rhododendron simsii]